MAQVLPPQERKRVMVDLGDNQYVEVFISPGQLLSRNTIEKRIKEGKLKVLTGIPKGV